MIIDVPMKVKEEKPKPTWYLTDEQIAEINRKVAAKSEFIMDMNDEKSNPVNLGVESTHSSNGSIPYT